MIVDRQFEPQISDRPGHLRNLLPNTTASYRQMQREIDRINLLKKIIPATTIILLVTLVLWPVLNNKEGSFTLAVDRLDKRDENAKLIKPRYVGVDRYGQPVNISAETAFRKSNNDKDYYLKNLIADMKMHNGTAVRIQASSGKFNADIQEITLDSSAKITTENNFELTADEARFMIDGKIATGDNGVAGRSDFGSFKADKFHMDVDKQILHLKGRVRLHYNPD